MLFTPKHGTCAPLGVLLDTKLWTNSLCVSLVPPSVGSTSVADYKEHLVSARCLPPAPAKVTTASRQCTAV